MKTRILFVIIAILALNTRGKDLLKDFHPTNPWEHYCKYNLQKLPEHTTPREYNYFLDCFSGGDEYDRLISLYE